MKPKNTKDHLCLKSSPEASFATRNHKQGFLLGFTFVTICISTLFTGMTSGPKQLYVKMLSTLYAVVTVSKHTVWETHTV